MTVAHGATGRALRQLADAERQAIHHTDRVKDLALWRAAAFRLLRDLDQDTTDLHLLGQGNNVVFRVGAPNGPLVLRLHRPGVRPREVTEAELRFQAALSRRAAVRMPTPMMQAHGGYTVKTIVQGTGPVHADLSSWCPGEVRRPGSGLTLDDARRAGAALARIHQFSETYPAEPRWPVWNADTLFTAASPYEPGDLSRVFLPEQRAVLNFVEQRTREVLRTLPRRPDTFGVIHADFILGNLLFADDEVTVLDFDDCGLGWFVYDLCPLLGNLADQPDFAAWKQAVFSGYASIRALPDGALDKAVLQVLMAARHAAQCLWGAGLVGRGAEFDVGRHTAWRFEAIRRLLGSEAPFLS
ncbi:phosphotransferase enzyme family protein [Deinococcus sonorensis]|uniref:Phosphotransferase n=2 Tax=Deinococcus sonorensis TaxID=309891 RepID=A0AAU7U6F7_9DEIO